MPDSLFRADFFALLRTVTAQSRLRLAPTPSGYLHAGNALNFALNWVAARLVPGASLLLRIDDLDAERKRPEYIQDIFDMLHWLGLDWDDGPQHAADFETNWSQHRRLAAYQEALSDLRAGGYLFPCSKSRRDLEPYAGAYPAHFRHQNLDFDAPDVAWRIRTPEGFSMPDFIVRRRDGLPAYQIASLVDDRLFGITHIIRGADLEASTQAQRYLASCLGWNDFGSVTIFHHPLLLDPEGAKLSKSAGAAALRTWREEGRPVREVFEIVGRLLGFGAASAGTAGGLLEQIRPASRSV